jgi:uncharacterized membrane protein
MRAGKQQEVVSLWPGTLELKKIDAKGAEEVLTFVPANVRFVIERDFNERVQTLWLRDRETRIPLGGFLSPEEKLSFSKAFGAALRKARA